MPNGEAVSCSNSSGGEGEESNGEREEDAMGVD